MPKNIIKAVLAVFVCLLVAAAAGAAVQFYSVGGGSTVEINEHAICKKVSNAAGSPAVFVPTNTKPEWEAFISNKPANVGLAECCTPQTCASLGKECNSHSDGCGGTLNCGTCVSPKTCNTSGYCCRGGSTQMAAPPKTCANSAPPADPSDGRVGKKIFVTSVAYSNSQITSDSVADGKCQSLATAAGMSGTFKALVWLGNRNPATANLLGNYPYWNCEMSGTNPIWYLVAWDQNGFWSSNKCATPSSVLYLPINFDEKGVKRSGDVWTGFSYDQKMLSPATVSYICPGTVISTSRLNNCIVFNYSTGRKATVVWHGFSYDKSERYALANEIITCNLTTVNSDCNVSPTTRRLYCVQQ